ncbi:MAG TPA: hypothetical protein VK718_11025 [Ferruginibacter sp.]|jgi:hypothetical protein|nr:hypothetical protein [Ferruginibacter sp.]
MRYIRLIAGCLLISSILSCSKTSTQTISLTIDSIRLTNLPTTVVGKSIYLNLICSNGNTVTWGTITNIPVTADTLFFALTPSQVITDLSGGNQIILYQQSGSSQSPTTDPILYSSNSITFTGSEQGDTLSQYPTVLYFSSGTGFYTEIFNVSWQ